MKNLIKFSSVALLVVILGGCGDIQNNEYTELNTVESNVSVDYELHPEKDKLYINVDINGHANDLDYDIIEYINNNYAQPVAPQPMPVAQPIRQQTTATVQPQVQAKKMTTPVNSAPVNQSNPNIDNLKFLESMTAIYEKSGRHDLARGLKASLSKNNIK